MVRRGRVSRSQPCPHAKGQGLQHPKILGIKNWGCWGPQNFGGHPIYAHIPIKFGMVMKQDKSKILQGWPCPWTWTKILVTQMLMHYLFALLLVSFSIVLVPWLTLCFSVALCIWQYNLEQVVFFLMDTSTTVNNNWRTSGTASLLRIYVLVVHMYFMLTFRKNQYSKPVVSLYCLYCNKR